MRKTQRKIQLYLSESKDAKLCNLIDRLEIESDGKRGYVPDKIKEMLKAFELIAEHFGKDDPMEVLLKVVQGSPATTATPQKEAVKEKTNPVVKEKAKTVNPMIDAFIDAENNDFGIK